MRYETPTVGVPGRGLAGFAMRLSKLRIASRDDNQPPRMTIHFGTLDFPSNSEGEATMAPEARPPPPRSLGTTLRVDGASRVECTLRAPVRFGSLDFVIDREGNMVRAMPAQPTLSENFDAVSLTLGTLSLAPRRRRRRPRPALPSEANKIRRHITIHMGQTPCMMICRLSSHPTQKTLCRMTRKSHPTTMGLTAALVPSRLDCAMPWR